MQMASYFGPCPPAGAPHHYIFTLIATDLEPAALQAGMTQNQVSARVASGSRNRRVIFEPLLPGEEP